MLKQSHQFDYIFTKRLNQDYLENLFACIRQTGISYYHPDAVSFQHKLRKIILGKEVALVSEKSTVRQNEEHCDFFWLKYPTKHSKSDSDNHELAVEICLTSLLIKDVDLEMEAVDDEVYVEFHASQENGESINISKSVSTVMREQSL